MKRGRSDPDFDGPVHSAPEDVSVVSVQPEDEAAVDHDAEAVESAHNFAVIPAEVLSLSGALEAPARKRFESHEQTSQTGGGRIFDQIVAQNRVDGRCSLKDAAHPPYSAEQIARESGIPEKVIVEEIEMSAGKARNFGQRVVNELRVETTPPGEERI